MNGAVMREKEQPMSAIHKRLPTPAMLVSCIALVVSLGGVSYAAGLLPANSVGQKQLKKNAVTRSKIKANAVTRSKIKANAVTRSKIKANAVNGAKVAANSLTGNNILESSVGKVPAASSADNAGHATNADHATSASNAASAGHATNADNATNAVHATNADTVGGQSVRTFSKLVATNTPTSQTALDFGGFKLNLACDASGNATVTGIGSVTGSMIRGMKITNNGDHGGFGNSSTTAGIPENVLFGTDNWGGITVQYVQPDGHVVSVNAYVDNRNTINGFNGCSLSGSAISG